MEVRRIDPSKGFLNEIRNINRKVTALETRPSGNIVIRETLSTEDPETGVVTIIGQLPDGSIGFQPFIGDITPPPVATAPTVSAEPGTFVLSWDGTFVAGALQPRDFEQVNVIGRMYGTTETKVVGIIRKAGAPAFVSTDVVRPGTDWEFALESEDYNGNKALLSDWSAPLTMIDAISSVDIAWTEMKDDVEHAKERSTEAQTAAGNAQSAAEKAAEDALKASGLVAGKGRVLFQSEIPEGDDKENTLWIDTTNGANTPKRWDGSEWVAVTDKVAVEAAAAALSAEITASQAFSAAEQAAAHAGEALTAANGKNRNWYTPDQPAGVDHKEGDTWFDTANGNRIKVWSGGKWNDAVDKAITDAAKVADEARDSANGKNTNTYSANAPTLAQGAGRVEGDTWFREDADGNIYGSWTWDGAAWISKKYRHEVIDSVDAGKITTGTVDALRIGAKSISVEKLLVSSTDNLISDADFTDPKGVSWSGYSGAYVREPTAGRNGGPAMKIVNAASQQGKYNNPDLPTQEGNAYRVGAWIKSSVQVPVKGIALYCRQKTLKGATYHAAVVWTNTEVMAADEWVYVSQIYKTVTDATTVSFGIFSQTLFATGEILVDYMSATRATDGSLVVDGSVTADSIASNQINADHIAAGSVNATHIGAKAITADKLVLTSSDNMIIEPDFSNGGKSWQNKTNMSFVPNGGRNGASMRFTDSTVTIATVNTLNKIPVADSDRFRVQVWYKTSAAQSSGRLAVMIRCYTTQTTYTDITALSNTANTKANVWDLLEGQAPTLPLGTIAVEFYIKVQNSATTVVTDIDYISVTRASDASLIVDGSVTAKKLETDLVLTTKIIAGDPVGVRAEMAPDGFKVFGKASGDTTSTGTYEIVRLGVADTNDMFAIADKDGITQASISETGTISGKQLYASEEIVYQGQSFSELLWDLPKGHMASGYRTTNSAYNARAGGQWAPYLRIEVELERHRLYKVSTSQIRYGQDAGGTAAIQIVQATGSVATISNGTTISSVDIMDGGDGNAVSLGEYTKLSGGLEDGPPGDVVTVSYLLMFRSFLKQFAILPSGGQPVRLMVEDMGPLRGTHTGIHLDTTSTNGVPPAAPPSKTTRTTTWNSNWIRSFGGNGAHYNYNTSKGYQGLSPAGYGNMKTVMNFPDLTGTLSGSVVHSIKVYLYFEHWYYNAGGTARIGLSSGAVTSYAGKNPVVTSGGWPKPGGRWVTIPASYHNGFVTGAYKGITLEGDGTYGTYGIVHPGKIQISYSK